MTNRFFLWAAMVVASMAGTPAAYAGEFRLGVFNHDVEIAGIGGSKGKEAGAAIALDLRVESPTIFEAIWSPKPYVYVSGNLDGNTSHAGAGLAWQKGFLDYWYGEFAFGISGHNGEERVANPADAQADLGADADPADVEAEISRRFARKNQTIEFGSTLLFRMQLAVGYDWTDSVATELVYEHLSNGTLIGGPENEGLDNIGLRVAFKY